MTQFAFPSDEINGQNVRIRSKPWLVRIRAKGRCNSKKDKNEENSKEDHEDSWNSVIALTPFVVCARTWRMRDPLEESKYFLLFKHFIFHYRISSISFFFVISHHHPPPPPLPPISQFSINRRIEEKSFRYDGQNRRSLDEFRDFYPTKDEAFIFHRNQY